MKIWFKIQKCHNINGVLFKLSEQEAGSKQKKRKIENIELP